VRLLVSTSAQAKAAAGAFVDMSSVLIGPHAVMTKYGNGVYFARDSSYSSSPEYATPDAGVQCMFLCRVVVGEYCKGVSDVTVPAARISNSLFDTTVDDMANPSIYVTYHDAQAYPKYLVRFRQ